MGRRDHRAALGCAVDAATAFASCGDLAEEFKVIRRAYHRKVLAPIPTKAARAKNLGVQSAFEVLREFYDRGRVITFRSEENNQTSTSDVFQNHDDYFAAKEARGTRILRLLRRSCRRRCPYL